MSTGYQRREKWSDNVISKRRFVLFLLPSPTENYPFHSRTSMETANNVGKYLPPHPSPSHDPWQRPSLESVLAYNEEEEAEVLEPGLALFAACGPAAAPPVRSTAYRVLNTSRKASISIQNIPRSVLGSSSEASAGRAHHCVEEGPHSPRYSPGSAPFCRA